MNKNNINRNSKNDMLIKKVSKNMTLDRIEWWERIHVVDPD
jgi:hypothetical protein